MIRLLLTTALSAAPALAAAQDWTTFNGDPEATKYSPAEQFTPENVETLERVWEVRTGDVSDGSGDLPQSVWSATPIYAGGLLYFGTPFYRILALDPATGEEVWSYDSQSTLEALTQPALKNRGVSYWTSGEEGVCESRIFLGTMDAHLHVVDAETGELCEEFSDGGILDVNQWNTTNDRWPLSLLQPPTIVNDHVVIGWAGMDWTYSEAPPGTLFSVNARTGELEWEVNFIPDEIREQTGTANIWASMAADPETDMVYVPVSSPSPNYWGGNRTEDIPLATSVTAIDAGSGEIVWSRQLVHHDVWDYDTNAAPALMDLTVDGETVPALVQTTKQGMLYVLNRETGEPIFGWEEREVPLEGAVADDALSPTQPFVSAPPPTNDLENMPGVSRLADVLSGGQCSRDLDTYLYEGVFTPPSEQGTFLYPSTVGGMQWGGPAVDPRSGIAYVNSSSIVDVLTLIPREEYERITSENDNFGGGESGYYPQEGSPWGFRLNRWFNWAGMPCWEGPYGTFSAYDLNTGERLYEVPFGVTQKWGFYMPDDWGSPTIGGPALTAGGVIFIGASMDARVRALDAATGREIWNDLVAAPAVATPAVFTHEGRDYVVFTVGGNSILKPQVADQIVAYALPD
ncbi:PQQ-binding-like beta-propeller repeat protein [Wenxinia saemankumensis]|uniref:Quinoprotein glucose dehydrogenase n=1 Tax=Wenxinia saemankumensis TaxID=1447782 RepID=A0A1M6HAT2_9RHOB|nr:PQQ-binding-like beta-propeller repeat protein [Wenxinia saemankumensis]SHJ19233.1 quinoprotein glucose dehydrogenase [Wenxinia saemankumensis]